MTPLFASLGAGSSRGFGRGLAGVVKNGLILHYDFENSLTYPGTGTTITDLGPYGNNGTLVNSPTFSNTTPKFFQFNGVNTSISVTETFGMTPQIVTVDFVVKINSTVNTPIGAAAGLYQNLIFRQNTRTGAGYEAYSILYFETNSAIVIQTTTAAGVEYFIESAVNSAIIGSIYHISAVFDSTLMSLYINGNFAGSVVKTTGIDYNATHTMKIGRANAVVSTYDEPANCNIYNVRLYNRALSASEVSQNYNALRSLYQI